MINATKSTGAQAWKDFNLPKTIQDCNMKLIEMDDTKRASVSSKKVLAEQTRSFNKMTPEESLGAIPELLKLYQV